MKLIAVLCFIGLATATSPSWQWQPGKEHVFHYSGRLLSGIPGLRPHFSGIGIETQVHLQVKSIEDIRLSLRKVNYTQVNGPLSPGYPRVTSSYEGSNWRHVLLPQYTQAPIDIKNLLKVPVTFALRDGEIKTITVSGTEQEWSLNFKKALVALFQTKMESSSLDLEMNTIVKDSSATQNYWKVSEETIEGVCDVIYQVNELPEYIVKERADYFPKIEACTSKKFFEVTKTKEIDSCKKSAVYTFLKPSMTSSSCNSFKCLSNIFGSASSVTKYYACGTRSNLVLQTIVNEGEVVQKPIGTKSEHIVTGTRQVLKLRAIESIQSEVPKPPQPRTTESIMYEYINSGEVRRQQIGVMPKISQSESKSGDIYKFLPRHFNPAPESRESKEMLSSFKVKSQLKDYIVTLINDLTTVEDLTHKEIPLRLTSIIRGMTLLKVEDIKSLYSELKSSVYSPSHANPEKISMFHNIFFDAVMVSGTTPAVIFLKEMIKSKEMSPYQATYILMLLPHHIITPTKEVFTSMLEIIQSEPVMSNTILYNTAILSMSNLVEKTCLEKSRQVTYPTAVFGQFCDSHSEVVTEKWIPYLSKSLETAPTADRRNVIIMALGILKHKDVITILLPVIEGNGPITRPSGVSGEHVTFRNISRSVSIYAIGNVGKKHPDLVLPILFSIYANPAENTLMRADALQVMMNLNPPMNYLQKIAAMTWSEKNADILKKTYTTFYTLAHFNHGTEFVNVEESSPESTLSKKAQMVIHLMRKTKGVAQSSGSIYDSSYLPLLEVGYTNVFSWVNSYRSVLPSDVYMKLVRSMGEYKYKAFEAAFKLYGNSELMEHINNFGSMSESEQKTAFTTLFDTKSGSSSEGGVYGGRYTSESRNQAIKDHENQFLLKTGPTGLLEKTIQSVKEQLHSEWMKVVKQLNIETREDGPLASLIYLNIFDDATFFASLSDITASTLKQKILPYLKEGQTNGWASTIQKVKSTVCEKRLPINGQKMINLGSAEFLIPSDMGFPIIIEQNMPALVSIRGNMEMNCNVQTPTLKLDALPMVSAHYHIHVGTYSPFTQKAVVAGLKQDLTINIPTRTHLMFQPSTNEFKVIFKPVEMRKPIDLIHFSTKPFTTAQSYFTFTPLCQSSDLRYIKSNVPMRTMSLPTGGSVLGLSLSATIETETPFLDVPFVMQMAKIYKYNPINMMRFLFSPHSISQNGLPSIRRHTFKVTYDSAASSTEEAEFSFLLSCATKERAMKEPLIHTIGLKTTKSQSPLFSWFPYGAQSHPLSSKVMPTLQKAMKTIMIEKTQMTEGFAGVVRMEAKFHSGMRPRHFTYQISAGKGLDAANNTRWYALLETEPSSPSMVQKICIDGKTTTPSVPTWDIGMSRNTNMNMLIKNTIGFGRTCNESQVRTYVTARVSENQLQWSRVSPAAKRCEEYMEKRVPGALTSPECQETRWLAKMYDEVDIKFESINLPVTIKNTVVKTTASLQSLLWPYVTENHSFNHVTGHFEPKRESSVYLTFHKPSESVSFTLKTPERHVKFSHVRVPYTLRTIVPFVAGESNIVKSLQLTSGHRFYPTCHIEKDWLRTFDNRSMPLKMDDCFHVIAGDCSTTMKFGVLARTVPHTIAKEMKIYLGKTEIIFTPSQSYSRGNRDMKIHINGTQYVIPREITKTFPVGSVKPVVRVYRSIDDVYHITGIYHSLHIRTDGERIDVSPSGMMKGRLCGICGDMNGQTLADISGPRRCIFSSPLVEVASYRYSTPTCSPLESEIKQKLDAETSRCARYEEIPTEVIKTYTSIVGKCSRQQHMILERGSETCFSTTPVTQCGAQCSPKPKQLVPKKVGFHCMKRGRVTELYREKVIQGLVLPELQSRPVTFSTAILVPQSCSSIISGHPILSLISSSNFSSSGSNGEQGSGRW